MSDIPFYSARSTLSVWHLGRLYYQVIVHWYVADRTELPAPLDDLFEDVSEVADDEISMNFSRQFFSQEELDQFQEWMQKHDGPEVRTERISTPLPVGMLGLRDFSCLPVEGFFHLDIYDEWDLSFAVHGYYTTMLDLLGYQSTIFDLFHPEEWPLLKQTQDWSPEQCP